MRLHLFILMVSLLAGCGSRSAVTPPGDGGNSNPLADQDLLSSADAAPKPDICAPMPMLAGYIMGTWKGQVECSGAIPPVKVKGELSMSLGGDTTEYQVMGNWDSASGTVDPLDSYIDGSVTCSEFEAEITEFLVSLHGLQYTLAGSMTGSFDDDRQVTGVWQAEGSDAGMRCQAKGTWSAGF